MKKHIKVRCKLLPDNKNFSLEVLEQSHRGHKFGNHPENDEAFKQEDVTLYSDGCPEFKKGKPYYCASTGELAKSSCTLYLRGDMESQDRIKLKIHLEYYPKIKAAIEAYNKHFS